MSDASPVSARPRRRLARRLFIGLVTLPVGLGLYACGVEPYWIEVTRHEVGDGAREVTLLHLTDLHVSTPGRRERRVLEIVNGARPDLIVITGDSILSNFDPPEFTRFLSELKAPLGVYACPGNWEEWVGSGVYDCYARAGVRLLDDSTGLLRDGTVELVGLRSARSRIPDGAGRLRIALCHYPAILPAASARGIDLLFAGHTHGGQVRLPLVGALHLPFDSGGYEAGWYREGRTRMYVSRGVGTSILPVRFGCRPEVAIHRIRF